MDFIGNLPSGTKTILVQLVRESVFPLMFLVRLQPGLAWSNATITQQFIMHICTETYGSYVVNPQPYVVDVLETQGPQ